MPLEEKERPQATVSVPADDPQPPKKTHEQDKVAKAREELKKDSDELVRPSLELVRGGDDDSLADPRPRLLRPQNEEDAALKGELEMLVERLRVRSLPLLEVLIVREPR